MSASGVPQTTYLEPHDAKRLRELAKAADRSIAAEIRQAVRQHLLTSESPAGQPSSRNNPGVKVAGHVVPGE